MQVKYHEIPPRVSGFSWYIKKDAISAETTELWLALLARGEFDWKKPKRNN
jgi:hypothetical protein